MKSEHILEALGNISESYIEEALLEDAIDLEEHPKAAKNVDVTQKDKTKLITMVRWVTSIAAVFCLIVAGLVGTVFYKTPVTYLSMDVNPSIELSVNSFHHVIGVTAYNEDGEKILENLELKNHQYLDAVREILCDEKFRACVDKNGDLTVAVCSEKSDKILAELRKLFEELGIETELTTHDLDTLHEAHDHDCSLGKYVKWQELHSYDETCDLDEAKDMTMHEINEKIHECQHPDQSQEEHHDSEKHETDTHKSKESHSTEHHNISSHTNETHETEQHAVEMYHETEQHAVETYHETEQHALETYHVSEPEHITVTTPAPSQNTETHQQSHHHSEKEHH